MKLTAEQWRDLHWLSKQKNLVWGGVYDQGGHPEVFELERRGWAERVPEPYRIGRSMFGGGYRITPAGRLALSEKADV